MAKKEKTPSVLAFEKKLVPSDGYLFGTSWSNRKEFSRPLSITSKSVRGTISNRLKNDQKVDPAKLDAKIENPNPQIVDSCSLNIDEDTLRVHFTLKVLGDVGSPSACNDEEFRIILKSVVEDYKHREGFAELGRRYATNIANGRFLWRNRVGADNVEVSVKSHQLEKVWNFSSMDIPMRTFDCADEQVESLGQVIAETLSSENGMLFLEIDAYAQIGQAQEVYPSEELVLGKKKNKSDKSKILYSIGEQAGLHSQKIGNALRTIDTWYPEFDDTNVGPIAIEVYGAVTNLGRAFRAKNHFYSLFDRYSVGEKLSRIEDEHYVMGVLVRGGVFGKSSKE